MFEMLMVLAFAWAGFVHLVAEGEETDEKDETGAGERRRDLPWLAATEEVRRRAATDRRNTQPVGVALSPPCRRRCTARKTSPIAR